MSKSRALAGLRVGYAIGDADLIEALTRVKDSFNSYPLGRPAQAGAIASLEDEAYFQQARARVIEGREWLNRGLAGLGFEVLPSAANFVFARHPAHRGAALAAALRQRAVIVRHFAAPRIADFLRITVGNDGQIDRLLAALSDILGSEPAGVGQPPYVLTSEEEADIDASLDEAERGEFATEKEVRAMWTKHGLR
jgi:histidinol-phosphate aminotransferase